MAELSFGEKLLIARKQLDLFQYQMAERLGVHPNSIAKYERGEGKPHAAVVRIFDLLCEQQGIRFDEYETAQTSNAKLDRIAKTGDATHKIVNSQRTVMLSLVATLAERIAAENPQDTAAQTAARVARREADDANATSPAII